MRKLFRDIAPDDAYDFDRRRVEVLEGLGLMDSPPEERFDRLSRMAGELMQAPIAYISLINTDRQWFKSSCGLGDLEETPRSGSFCDFAIRSSKPTVILDASRHPVFRKSVYVVGEPYVRFYIGFPLHVLGQRVGTLCTIDTVARSEVTQEQLSSLEELARLAEAELTSTPTSQNEP